MIIKAITLWQPWAELIAKGFKKYETRGWYTPHRGKLAIHAAKRPAEKERRYIDSLMQKYPATIELFVNPLPLGAVVCVVDLVRVHNTEDIVDHIDELEFDVGDYDDGRFAWELELLEVFDPPIPASGSQGLWDWNNEGVRL